jgi:hypothetical protein
MVGNFCQCPAVRGDHPNIGVVAVVIRLTGAVRHKCDPRAVRRPLRISIVPVLTIGDLLRVSVPNADDPEMTSFIVEPSCVIELVAHVRVVTHVALPVGG